jgi:DNA mismatch repair protein MutS
MEEKLSPMLAQYKQMKEKYEGCILFFRLGDFYEMFFEDAVLVSGELSLTLTSRACGLEEKAPMCGVPYHSAAGYIAKLVEKGYKVAICEQMEDPKATTKLVERDVIRIVTPGTITDPDLLEGGANNYLCTCYSCDGESALTFCDISTGEIYVTRTESQESDAVMNEISRYMPSEFILGAEAAARYEALIREKFQKSINRFETEGDETIWKETIAENCPEGVGLSDVYAHKSTVFALGMTIEYLKQTQKSALSNLDAVVFYETNEYMQMDANAIRNLELLQTVRGGERRGSLLWVLDKTKTNMGARLLKKWIEKPLLSPPQISRRNFAVREFVENIEGRSALRNAMAGIRDIPRLITRISLGSANPRDLLSLKESLCGLGDIQSLISGYEGELLKTLQKRFDPMRDIFTILDEAIDEEAPVSIKDGGIIKEGYNEKVDEYRIAMTDTTSWLAKMEAEEREKTGIKTLKIGYNRVFGYYIEVSKSLVKNVPDYYVRKQTLTNGERYITPDLKELENKVLSAKEKRFTLEEELFMEVLELLKKQIGRLKNMADVLAQLDVLTCFAHVAQERNFICPEVTLGNETIIKDGRHPVVELVSNKEIFVPNDTNLGSSDNRMMIITGPNMAGKSTYMRQVALIVLMAQIGCFVPASYAKIGIVDKIFTRVGASDDLSTGQSTFMVEMNEVSYILKNATEKSLLILDEIGRGTSTYDGLSIAWSVVEYIEKKIKAKTLFATHYHELTELEKRYDDVKNFCVAVKKRGEEITFLRKIIRGGADESYGVEVAALAGIPKEVVTRARQILKNLEENDANRPQNVSGKRNIAEKELPPMEALAREALLEEIKKTEVLVLSPLEAQAKLNEIVNRARNL